MTKNDRAKRVHRLIALGALVEKAGLGWESSATILGLLLAAARALSGERGAEYRQAWRAAGAAIFEGGGGDGTASEERRT